MPRRLLASLICLTCYATLAAAQVHPASRVRVAPDIMKGLLQKKVDPVYPPLARQARVQGTVVLQIVISKSGDVQNLQLVSGHPILAPAAIEAVKQWKYSGYTLNGVLVDVETTVQVNFTLDEKPPAVVVVGGNLPTEITGKPILVVPDDSSTVIPAPSPQLGTPQRVRVSSGVAQGLLISKMNPVYPPDARDQRVQGIVILKVNLGKEGKVDRIELISGHPLLAPAAIDAVKQWKYKPFLLNGTPVEVETQVQVNFTLME
jgi:TonB family protein